jgi:hypothetical protein
MDQICTSVERKERTLHWKLICSRFSPPISGGAPNKVGPKTIDKLDIDMELVADCSWILIISLIKDEDIPVEMAHEIFESGVIRIREIIDLTMQSDIS